MLRLMNAALQMQDCVLSQCLFQLSLRQVPAFILLDPEKKSHSSCGGFAPYIEESLSNMHCGHATLFSPFRSSFLRKVALYFLAKDEDLYASQVLPLGHNQYATLMKSGKGANRTLQKKIAKGMKRRKG